MSITTIEGLMSEKLSEKSKRCACGFEVAEFAFGSANINNTINELRVHEPYKLSADLIKLHQQVAGHALEHLHNVRDFCNIETAEEEKRLIKLKTDLSQINNFDKRIELSDNTAFIIDSIRKKLAQCKEGG